MHTLEFHPGPRLTYHAWDSDQGCAKTVDVTDRAAHYLFESTALKGATLADCFELIRRNPALITIYYRHFIDDYLAEAAKGPLPQTDDEEEHLEHLEIYHAWELDSSSNELHVSPRPDFHGVGVVRTRDSEDGIYKAGERTHWGISGAHVRQMLTLEVRHNPEVLVTEADMARKRRFQVIRTEHVSDLTLGAILEAIVWEISFMGGVTDTQETEAGLKEQVDALDARGSQVMDDATEEEVQAAENNPDVPVPVFTSERVFGFRGYPLVTENFSHTTLVHPELDRFLKNLDDDVIAAEALREAFDPEAFALKPECEEMTAYQLRRRALDARLEGGDAA